MRFTVLYLARLREALGRGSEQVELPADSSVATLLDALRARGGSWAAELAAGRAVRVAVNQEMTDPAATLRDGDEVALFPPVTGG
ncbi:MAG: molybdopterin converting factor subunit 1 [Betaproteobacteria bacterium]|nr:molybdopterin converting factor subunit 1 [Betaproteobacteria bacterium]MBK9606495.1 molybdopterin converting factor subunit 1 [Betaproteobacteria bacterium]